MKKSIALVISISLAIFSGCKISDDDDGSGFSFSSIFTSHSGTIVTATESVNASYSASSSPTIIEVSPKTAQITISGLSANKTLWMTKTNPTEKEISAGYTRAVSSGTNISLANGNITSSGDSGGGLIEWITDFFGGNGSQAEGCLSTKLNAKLALELEESSARSISFDDEPLLATATAEVNYSVGATKQIYVDTDSSISKFLKKPSTLRAKGTYCYVWVVDEFYKTTKGGKYVDSAIAQSIATNFDKIYPMVRKVFGNESDEIIGSNSISNMSNYSDTGIMVNIVVYDIGNDYSAKNGGGGVVGYFYSKEYYSEFISKSPETQYTNKGKYFYIDSYYAANKTAMVYSTLAHEFQHMVDFGVKTMAAKKNNKSVSSSSWYNEMKSMLCEDIMKNYLKTNNTDFTDEDSPFGRLPMFCRHYYDVGLEYLQSGYNERYTYANNYAFGAWAARNYGGVSFINKIATNTSVDVESITAASRENIETMLKNYTAACVVNKSGYGFNKSLTQSTFSSNNYYYPLDAVDLWNLNTVLPKTYAQFSQNTKGYGAYYSFSGPAYFGYNSQQALRPYGITISKVGVSTGSTVTLNFNTNNIDDAQRTYIIIE